MTHRAKKDHTTEPGNSDSHRTAALFSEWPAPADTVAGFGGDPDKADKNQWTMKKKAPDTK